ncbi:MAG: Phosphopantetheine adenylyltransferase [Firmicutes bacterium ADurb.Bin182]|nr:MAG: Phosphopantetheine adenylyltransferase [Firmicutes bacterium ADurb.Bin182]
MKIGVYPGSFDPFTSGHMDVLVRASAIFDKLYAAVLINKSKQPFFSTEERICQIEAAVKAENLNNVEVSCFDGLLADYAKRIKASFIVRGLRAMTDFEYEIQIYAMNRKLAPEIETVYFMAKPEYSFLSSSMVKEVGYFGGSIEGLVPKANQNLIAERLLKR